MMATLEHLMVEANKDGRMCPQPMVWNWLRELLPNAPGLPYLGRRIQSLLGKQRFDGFVTNRIARNEKTTIGIVHQIGALWA